MNTDAFRALWKEAFGDTDAFLDKFFAAGFSPDRCQALFQRGQLAAALYWFDCFWQGKKLAYIYAVATAKALRRQGLCRKLMAQTHQRLAQAGYAGAVLVPADKALTALYEKLGYVPFGGMTVHTVAAAQPPVPLQPLSPEAYAAKKDALLDANAVRQSGATLQFLATYARFYEANGSIFCAAWEDGRIFFQEYLGDPSLVPGILAALGAATGTFRIPDGQTPFAMYRSFTEDPACPSYLGIALD